MHGAFQISTYVLAAIIEGEQSKSGPRHIPLALTAIHCKQKLIAITQMRSPL